MKERSIFAMPKTAFLVCFLLCGNFILSGKTAEQCPKNPLSPTSSVSGMVLGVIVGTEKVVNGVFSYFWYLGENSINQVVSVASSFEGVIASYTIKAHNLIGGLLGAIGGQIKSIYNGSTGSIRVLFDNIIKVENSAQKFVYTQVENLADNVVSGKFTGGITATIKHPFSSIAKGLRKARSTVANITSSLTKDVKKVVEKVRTTGVPQDVKDILGAPVKGVKLFIKETQTVIQTVKNETSQRISGYSSEFKNGGIIDKFVALGSVPVGIGLEAWSFTLKISNAFRKSVSASVKDIVQPFLGQVLTERLGMIVNLPLDITEGFYRSTMNFFSAIGEIVSKVTGGGSFSVQLNMVIKHPLVTLENAWNVTKQEVQDFSTAILGKELTAQLGSVLGSPGRAISSVVSSITGGQLGSAIKSIISKPIIFLENIWTSAKMTVGGITKGIIGEELTEKISEVLSAPGKAIANLTASITGGGSISTQIKTVLTSPIQTVKNVWTIIVTTTEGLITSITGGGSLSTQIKTVLTRPLTIVGNIWTTTKEYTRSISKSLLGENLTQKIGKVVSAPLETLSNVTASITGGGSFSTQIKTVLTRPLTIVENIWTTTKEYTKSVSKFLLGEYLTGRLGNVVSAPFKTLSNVIVSITGGGSFSTQIKTVLTRPLTIVANIWTTTKEYTKSFLKFFLGENLIQQLGNAVSSPFETLSNVTASITGGGSIGTQIKTVLSEPFVIISAVWQKIKSATESVTSAVFGGELSSKLSRLISSPFETISKLFKSLTGGFSASIHLSADGSGGGGIGGAVGSLLEAPIYVVQGTYKGIVRAWHALMNSLKGFYANIPFIGNGIKVDVEVKDGDSKTKLSIGGKGDAGSQSGQQMGAKAEAGATLSTKSKSRRRRKIRSMTQ